MIDGPATKPINPPEVIIPKPCTALTSGILAPALKSTGTIQQQPTPERTKPRITNVGFVL